MTPERIVIPKPLQTCCGKMQTFALFLAQK